MAMVARILLLRSSRLVGNWSFSGRCSHRWLSRGTTGWARLAPVLVVVAVRVTHEALDVVNQHGWYDTGQAVAFLTLQATAVGLSLRQMQGFDPAMARAVCGVPEPFEPAVVMAIGHAGDPDVLDVAVHREAEFSPRSRRPIGEFVYEGIWGTSWPR
jgi:hypothetical protein